MPVSHWGGGGIARSDGIMYGEIDAVLPGPPVDGPVGTFALWAKLSADIFIPWFTTHEGSSSVMRFDLHTTGGFVTGGGFSLSTLAGFFGGRLADVRVVDGEYNAGRDVWTWYGWSWNLGSGPGLPRWSIYMNDSPVAASAVTLFSGDVGYSADQNTLYSIFGGGGTLEGCIARTFMSFDTEYEFTVEANRRFFIDAAGNPVTVPTGGVIDIPNGHPDQNIGSAGAFPIVNGPFLACADAPNMG